jgi:hypothetical protein
VISFAKEPFVVTFDDGTTATDDGDILLLGVEGQRGLILAARKLEWVPLEKISVVGQLVSDMALEGEMITKDTAEPPESN